MYYKYIILLSIISVAFSQVSVSQIERLQNEKLDDLRRELIEQRVENEVKSLNDKPITTVSINNQNSNSSLNEYFGYDYFSRNINFYDNIPTPADFMLGPGDEIIISIWGEVNSREKLLINKDGLIYFENIGFINLSNKSLQEATSTLKEEMSKIYSTLTDGSSNLMVELGQVKSINVYFSGQIKNPGINVIHPFSDILSAIVQAGGINREGSLRNIQIIRSNEVVETIDFYKFFISGKNNFSKTKILDNDVIHIPNVEKRVKISGEISNPGFYEIHSEDNLNKLIDYAGGLNATASSSAIIDVVIPIEKRDSDDYAYSSKNVNLSQAKNIYLNNGDEVDILKISNVSTKVEVLGRVKTPGFFSFNSNLREVLDLAGGFDDPFFKQTIILDQIVVLRKDSSQYYGKEFLVTYENSEKFALEPDDKIFIYENTNYRNSQIYKVEGEINKPGVYPLRKGITLSEAIAQAGGITEFGNINNISVVKELKTLSDTGEIIVTEDMVNNLSDDFELSANIKITILPQENVISVFGNVYSPGLIALDRNISLSKAIELAGGYKPYTMKKRVYVKRVNGEIDKSHFFRGRLKRIYPGDTIFVPVNPNPDTFDITSFIADLSTTLANIAAILIVIDNN